MIRNSSLLARSALLGGLLCAIQAPAAAAPLPVLPDLTVEELKAGARAALVDRALLFLEHRVEPLSHRDALRLAFQAYYNFQATHPQRVRNPYFYFVDFGLDAETPRGYVFDMRTLSVVDGPFTVAHGRGSAPAGEGVPYAFSNRPGSNATSLGLYVTLETYTFRGTAWGEPYRSVGMRLFGVSGGFNSQAFSRRVVAHGAPYVTAEKAGRSEGCPAMEPERAERLLPLLANGGIVFLFSPRDPAWLQGDPWTRGATPGSARLAEEE